LAPTFDHASSLGRELTDEARKRHLHDGTVERYIWKGRGGIFEHAQAKHGMSPMALAKMVAQRYPEFFRPWQTRVANLPADTLRDLVGRVPGARMSKTSRTFVLAFLEISRKMLGHAL
jgi:hypothetical protein